MCRGDSTRDGCYTCLNSSIHDLTATCPNQKEALSWGGDPPCMARYADRPFFGILELGGYNTGDITLNITEFDTVWESLIDSVVRKASTGSSMYPMLLLRLQLWEGGRFSSRTLVIIVVPIAIFGAVLVILAVAFLLKRIKKTKQDGQNNKTHVESLQFGFTAVRVAIENFSDANMLGRGGFGSVYKAWRNWNEGPGMASVLVMLSSYSMSLPIPSRPGFSMNSTMDTATMPDSSSLSNQSKTESIQVSVNNASISELDPR
ncbi:hypothetical protein V6N12_063026 [Hibiscus sabdariffa]|uniref:Gnk2-homologous domain-containing protein n=1 Tax=Hibiscus sabdariffa TaxID=183260 RepID=A0ABR2FAK8_9ROSI